MSYKTYSVFDATEFQWESQLRYTYSLYLQDHALLTLRVHNSRDRVADNVWVRVWLRADGPQRETGHRAIDQKNWPDPRTSLVHIHGRWSYCWLVVMYQQVRHHYLHSLDSSRSIGFQDLLERARQKWPRCSAFYACGDRLWRRHGLRGNWKNFRRSRSMVLVLSWCCLLVVRSWCCLNEFNRIDVSVLSAISTQPKTIHRVNKPLEPGIDEREYILFDGVVDALCRNGNLYINSVQ